MVLSVVHPLGDFGLGVASKRLAVEITYKVLCRTAAEGASGIDVADKHPLLLVGTPNGQLHQVRAFPYSLLTSVTTTEAALLFPVLQVGRRVYPHLPLQRGGKDKNPSAAFGMPEHIRVAALLVRGDDGIVFVGLESPSVVQAIGKTLYLAGTRRGIDSDNGILAETSGVLLVHHTAAAENHSQPVGHEHRLFRFPVHQVGAGGVSPTKISPHGTVGIVLETEMIHPILVEHPVGIIHPAIAGSMMKKRAESFAVRCVKRIAPAGILHGIAYVGTAVARMHVQRHLAGFIRSQVERHPVIHAIHGKTYRQRTLHLIIYQYMNGCLRSSLFNGQQQILPGRHYLYQTMVGTQIMDLQSLLILRRTKSNAHPQQEEQCGQISFYVHNRYFMFIHGFMFFIRCKDTALRHSRLSFLFQSILQMLHSV